MLAAQNRMRRSEHFRQAMRRGRRVGHDTLVVHRWRDPARAGRAPLVGFVVSRRVGSAVTRATVVRRMRHLMRARLPVLHDGELVVVRATPRAAGASSHRLAADLEVCLRRSEAPVGSA